MFGGSLSRPLPKVPRVRQGHFLKVLSTFKAMAQGFRCALLAPVALFLIFAMAFDSATAEDYEAAGRPSRRPEP
jgi:hypothetical protein